MLMSRPITDVARACSYLSAFDGWQRDRLWKVGQTLSPFCVPNAWGQTEHGEKDIPARRGLTNENELLSVNVVTNNQYTNTERQILLQPPP